MTRACYITTDASRANADGLLREWGRMVRLHRDGFVDELSWTGCCLLGMIRESTGGRSMFTLPEAAIARLHDHQRGAITIGSFVERLPELERAVVYLWYVHERDAGEIAVDVGKARRSVYRLREQGILMVWTAMLATLPPVGIKRREDDLS